MKPGFLANVEAYEIGYVVVVVVVMLVVKTVSWGESFLASFWVKISQPFFRSIILSFKEMCQAATTCTIANMTSWRIKNKVKQTWRLTTMEYCQNWIKTNRINRCLLLLFFRLNKAFKVWENYNHKPYKITHAWQTTSPLNERSTIFLNRLLISKSDIPRPDYFNGPLLPPLKGWGAHSIRCKLLNCACYA